MKYTSVIKKCVEAELAVLCLLFTVLRFKDGAIVLIMNFKLVSIDISHGYGQEKITICL